jgi:hypothetical protein
MSRPASKRRAKKGSYDSLDEPTPWIRIIVAAFVEGGEVRLGMYWFTERRKRAVTSSCTPRGYPLICDAGITCDLISHLLRSMASKNNEQDDTKMRETALTWNMMWSLTREG